MLSLRDWLAVFKKSSRTPMKCRRSRLRFEQLEERVVPNAVSWNNSSSGNWETASNWSTGSVPGSTDDVTIDIPGITVSLTNASVTVDSLTCDDKLTISNTGQLTANNGFTLQSGQSITVNGSNSSFTASGTTTIDGTSLDALNGGIITLQNATSYTNTSTNPVLQASGTGSELNLPVMSTITGASGNITSLTIEAENGGDVDLHDLTTATIPQTSNLARNGINFNADGTNSFIDLSNLTTFNDETYFHLPGGSGLEVSGGGEIQAPLLQSTIGVNLTISDTESILPIAQYTSIINGSISVSGTGYTWNFPNLSDCDGSSISDFGGVLQLPDLESYSVSAMDDTGETFYASGNGSILDLSSMTSLTGSTAGSTGLGVFAELDGEVDLDNLTSVVIPQSSNGASNGINFNADGTGSLIDLSGLSRFTDETGLAESSMEVSGGGEIKMPLLQSVVGISLAISDGQSTISISQLTSITNGGISVSGQGDDLVFPNLSDIDASNATVSGGATLSLPEVTSFADSSLDGWNETLSATGPGSVLNLSDLTAFTGSPVDEATATIQAENGGFVNLHNLESTVIPQTSNAARCGISFDADGTNSILDLSNLTTFTDETFYHGQSESGLEASGGGEIEDPLLQTSTGANLTISDGESILPVSQYTSIANASINVEGVEDNCSFANLTSLNSVNLTAQNGGQVTFSTGGLTLTGDSSFTVSDDQSTIAFSSTPAVTVASGIFSVSESDLTISNILTVDQGATFEYGGAIDVAGNGAINTQQNSNLKLYGSLGGTTTNADAYRPLGTVTFSGGSSNEPLTLEAMSQDLGDTTSGLINNFGYGSIDLVAGFVQLIDSAHNSSGTGPEAVYAYTLSVPSGSSLDLNGLHIYAQTFQSGGTILNGTVTVLPDSGPILFNVVVAGTIQNAGSENTWTLSGKAGQGLTLVVNPGDENSPPPINPALGLVQIQLLSPSGGVLGSASDSEVGQDAQLSFGSLPSNGTYTVIISANASESNATGNYLLTAYDYAAISAVNPLPRAELTPSFPVSWSGSEGSGPGIASYSIYVSINGGTFAAWLTDTTETGATYTGTIGDNYAFYSIATDINGLMQSTPTGATATTAVPGPVDPANSLVVLPVSSIQLDGSMTVTLQSRDAEGNIEILDDLNTVTFDLEYASGGKGSFSNFTDNHNGTYSATFTGTLVGGNAIAATANGTPVDSAAAVWIVGGPVSLSQSTVSVLGGPVTAGTTTQVMLTANYPNDNHEPAGGLTVTFKLGSSTGGQGTFSAVTDAGNGFYFATFTGTRAGSNTVKAYINGKAVTSTAPSIKVMPSQLDLATSPVIVSTASMKANSTLTVTFQPEDAWGNKLILGSSPLPIFSLQSGAGKFGAVTYNKQTGSYSTTFTATAVGSYTIVTSYNNAPVTSELPTLNVIPAATSVAKSVITLSSNAIDSGTSITVTLQTADAYGNDETTGGLVVGFKLAGGTGQGTFGKVAYIGAGKYEATFTGTLAGKNTIEGTIAGVKVAQTQAITVSPGSFNLAKSVVSVKPSSIKPGSTILVTLQTKDWAGNDLTTNLLTNGVSITFVLSNNEGLQGNFSAPTYIGNGVYQTTFTPTNTGSNTVVALIDNSKITSKQPTISVS
jgi:hypothetical protein